MRPGYGPTTAIAANGGYCMQGIVPPDYAPFSADVFASLVNVARTRRETDVAEAVWCAVHDGTVQSQCLARADAVALALPR